jgi:aminoglycoside phosphotransferase (APT) family kinase protein
MGVKATVESQGVLRGAGEGKAPRSHPAGGDATTRTAVLGATRTGVVPAGRCRSVERSDSHEAFEAKLARILSERVTGFRGLVAAERLSTGASQETYRLVVATATGERRIALRRAPARERGPISSAGPGLRIEARLMAAARSAGVPEPEILYVLDEADGLGEGFLMEWLDGETLGTRIARGEEFARIRPKLARQCGAILARIHGIDLERAGLAGSLRWTEPRDLVRETWDLYQSYRTPQPMIDFTARWLLEHLPPPMPPRLVHGDFRNGNLMVCPERGVIAVLDWELAHVGDPVRDLGWICTNSWRFGRSELPVGGFGEIEDLLDGYASESGVRIDRSHLDFWIVFGSFWWSVGTLSMTQVYRSGIDRSVERVAVGRRSSECQVDCANLLIPGPVEGLPGEAPVSSLDMPRAEELLGAVRDFLRDEVVPAARGRTSFLARVAANSVDIVLRELVFGPGHRERERRGLEAILGRSGSLEELRWELVRRLRDGTMSLDHPGLVEHLRQTVVGQVAIDQPKYSGLRVALGAAHPR